MSEASIHTQASSSKAVAHRRFLARAARIGGVLFEQVRGMTHKASFSALAARTLVAVALGLAATPQSMAQAAEPTNKGSTTPAPTASAAKAPPEWGQGVLEAEFLTKLRLFLERDPLDFKEFERVFRVKLEVHPKEGPYHDGSWGMDAVGPLPLPFGRELRGGARGPSYHFIPTRNSQYLRIELLKPPRNGWTPESKLPCIQLSDVPRAFAFTQWERRQTYEELKGVPHFIGDAYQYTDSDGSKVVLSIDPRVQVCVRHILIDLPKMPSHPSFKK